MRSFAIALSAALILVALVVTARGRLRIGEAVIAAIGVLLGATVAAVPMGVLFVVALTHGEGHATACAVVALFALGLIAGGAGGAALLVRVTTRAPGMLRAAAFAACGGGVGAAASFGLLALAGLSPIEGLGELLPTWGGSDDTLARALLFVIMSGCLAAFAHGVQRIE